MSTTAKRLIAILTPKGMTYQELAKAIPDRHPETIRHALLGLEKRGEAVRENIENPCKCVKNEERQRGVAHVRWRRA